jgi:hypothetical protein
MRMDGRDKPGHDAMRRDTLSAYMMARRPGHANGDLPVSYRPQSRPIIFSPSVIYFTHGAIPALYGLAGQRAGSGRLLP